MEGERSVHGHFLLVLLVIVDRVGSSALLRPMLFIGESGFLRLGHGPN